MSKRRLTSEEKKRNIDTKEHINVVNDIVKLFCKLLISQAKQHDVTKMDDPEVALFAKMTPILASLTYDSEEYKKSLAELKPALEHHYAKNRHHPEHYPNGINDMTLIDLIEMFCDWKASTMRIHNGNLLKSIEINSKRFNIDAQLTNILKNTAELIDQVK